MPGTVKSGLFPDAVSQKCEYCQSGKKKVCFFKIYLLTKVSSWLIKGNKKKGKANPDGISGRIQE